MTKPINLHVTQKIEVSRDGKTWFNSSIQDIRPYTLSITTPYLKEHSLVIFVGDQVEVRFSRDDSSYLFKTRVTEEITNNIRLIRLAYPKQINRIQQRLHVRLPVVLDVEFAPVNEDTGFTMASSVNISGGGMKLAVRQPVKENKMLTLMFILPLKNKPEYLNLKAQVIRCITINPKTGLYHLGLKFDDINYRQQDIIVRFIFEKMALQKRLL